MTWTTQPRSELGPLAAITKGKGPVVVLIHGVGLRAEAWGGQIDALSQDHHVLAVDMPGHGASSKLAPASGLTQFTDAIATAISDTVDGPFVVVGHSFGAMIALDMAARYGERLRGVVAMNAIFRRSPEAAAAVAARAAELDGVSMADPSGPLARWFGVAPSAARDACRDRLTTVDPAGYQAAYRVFAQEDGPSAQALAALGCPALFLTGAQEPNSTPAMSHAMAALAPQGQAQVIADAAHMMPMTHARTVADILCDFAKGCAR
jgi:pimeloyl-ACP methyl ester carboxylesterase